MTILVEMEQLHLQNRGLGPLSDGLRETVPALVVSVSEAFALYLRGCLKSASARRWKRSV